MAVMIANYRADSLGILGYFHDTLNAGQDRYRNSIKGAVTIQDECILPLPLYSQQTGQSSLSCVSLLTLAAALAAATGTATRISAITAAERDRDSC